ncbi:MAG: hypothetical protein A2017_15705 [Lentisphaerae bacterium GWF2_44_16]|nr:MAG: hypothetical protein A2017_15705 [Lentisphaerae bacterium GWF2_44_16]
MDPKKVLIIDDEHTLLRLSQILLQRKGYEVFVALSVKEGRSTLINKGPVDIIVLDLMMPEENGTEFLSWQKEQPDPIKNIPIIINTAKNLSDEEKKYLEGCSRKIIQKGIDFTEKLIFELDDAFKNQ